MPTNAPIEEKARASELFSNTQKKICKGLEEVDGKELFLSDSWQRPDMKGSYGGGGDSRVLKAGAVFEQAGVNFSEVQGTLPASMAKKLIGRDGDASFFATGVSLVLHPRSPLVPTVHANFRYLVVEDKRWYGGGADLTPYVLYPEDCEHFHLQLKSGCDQYGSEYYPNFKHQCDEYFYLPHRQESRGIGGIFFDYLGRDEPDRLEHYYQMVETLSGKFLDSYLPIVIRRKDMEWTDRQRQFQLYRRGRYAEFNLLYDRGTQFGLQTSGRTESILMSLPPLARWEYKAEFPEDGFEQEVMEVVKNPRDWV